MNNVVISTVPFPESFSSFVYCNIRFVLRCARKAAKSTQPWRNDNTSSNYPHWSCYQVHYWSNSPRYLLDHWERFEKRVWLFFFFVRNLLIFRLIALIRVRVKFPLKIAEGIPSGRNRRGSHFIFLYLWNSFFESQ